MSTAGPKLSLSSPIKIGDVELRNRNVMSSLTRNRSVPDAVPNDTNVEYYTQRAETAGLVNTEGTLTGPQGTAWPFAPGLWNENQVNGWKKVTDSVHSVGGKIFAQVWHLGRIANNEMLEQKKAGKPVPGPSALYARTGEGQFVKYGLDKSAGYSVPVPIDNPWEYIEEYKRAAVNAKAAGFDGVELHSANGYLVHQFLDNTANKRTDEWGGSAENRTRFGLEIVKSFVEVFGPGRVGIKLSPSGGYNDMGMTLEDTIETFSYYIKQLVALDIAYVQLVRYLDIMDPVIDGKKRGTPHDIIETYGHLVKNGGKTKLLVNGGLNPHEANQLIAEGKIDAAVFGYLWIGNPDLQARIEKGVELNWKPDPKLFYLPPPGEEQRVGYSDYPKAT